MPQNGILARLLARIVRRWGWRIVEAKHLQSMEQELRRLQKRAQGNGHFGTERLKRIGLGNEL